MRGSFAGVFVLCAGVGFVACGGIVIGASPEPDGGPSTPDAATNPSDDSSGSTPDASTDSSLPLPDGELAKCSPQGPTVLTTAADFPREVAVDATNVYFSALNDNAESDAVYQLPKGVVGAKPLKLSDPDGQPYSLVSDGTYVYWNDTLAPGSIRRVLPGGGALTTLLAIDVSGVALSPTSLFWVTVAGTAQSMPKGGGAVTTLGTVPNYAPNSSVFAVATDANSFYFVATTNFGSTISSVPLSGGPVTSLATSSHAVGTLGVDSRNVYFVDGDALVSLPLVGGASSTVAHGFAGTVGLKIDSGNAYAAISLSSGGSIVRVPVNGGAPTVIATTTTSVAGFAVDDECVYWTNPRAQPGDAAIVMAAK